MLIDAEPLMPYLATMDKAEADLAASENEFAALSRSQQLAQVDRFLASDEAAQKAYDEARGLLIAAVRVAITATN